MKPVKLLIALFVLPLFGLTAAHKYYISITQINYIQESKSVQIISRIFIDDFENLLKQRYDENITLASHDELQVTDLYIERYLTEKLQITINGKSVNLIFIGKEYDADIMKCYLEIESISSIESIEIKNKILFDLYDDQQNIIKTKINSKQKSFILISQNDKAVLKFN